jgi:hypothetical protein
MAKQGFLRVREWQDAKSERPARWHGQPRPLRIDPRRSLMGRKERGSSRSRTDDGGFAIGGPPPDSLGETAAAATGRGARRGNSAALAPEDTDLSTVIAGWPHLAAATKAAILAIVRDGRGERWAPMPEVAGHVRGPLPQSRPSGPEIAPESHVPPPEAEEVPARKRPAQPPSEPLSWRRVLSNHNHTQPPALPHTQRPNIRGPPLPPPHQAGKSRNGDRGDGIRRGLRHDRDLHRRG